jgi:hypothetical protein
LDKQRPGRLPVSRQATPKAPAEWVHLDVRINIDPSGQFRAKYFGIALRSETLEDMKCRIDALVRFAPFQALVLVQSEVRHVVVVGVRGEGKNRRWVDSRSACHSQVLCNTPENVARLDAYLKARTAEAVRIEEQRAKLSTMAARLPWSTPESSEAKAAETQVSPQ